MFHKHVNCLSLPVWGSSKANVSPPSSRICKISIQYKKRIQKSTNLDLDWFMILPASYDSRLKRMGNGENVQRENKLIFFPVDMVLQSHPHITPGRSGTWSGRWGLSLVDLGLRENNSSKCFHLLVGSMTTVYPAHVTLVWNGWVMLKMLKKKKLFFTSDTQVLQLHLYTTPSRSGT